MVWVLLAMGCMARMGGPVPAHPEPAAQTFDAARLVALEHQLAELLATEEATGDADRADRLRAALRLLRRSKTLDPTAQVVIGGYLEEIALIEGRARVFDAPILFAPKQAAAVTIVEEELIEDAPEPPPEEDTTEDETDNTEPAAIGPGVPLPLDLIEAPEPVDSSPPTTQRTPAEILLLAGAPAEALAQLSWCPGVDCSEADLETWFQARGALITRQVADARAAIEAPPSDDRALTLREHYREVAALIERFPDATADLEDCRAELQLAIEDSP